MRRRICVLVVLLISLGLAGPTSAQEVGGGPSGGQDSGFQLGQNYPNPFNPETKIPFVLGEELFADGRPVVVSMRIYNVLQQFVAAPVALNHPGGEGVRVVELEYPAPGRYEAYWDGTDRSGNSVASGVYFLQLVVNGRSQVRKMFVTK
ncbi:MAG: hypothetical protein GWM92_16230 [Gemmatimonadetes bacterium]|nr:hypothetical protein [Gemmatimonadota bacterium]NIR80304.1 hypothetical protein [Gemmatimonadota bacterium]NIT89067.1 hypothetical protein [Gemmatimonadota bacterium]NIU32864.1 hypothetical protein [Gemmatimonadota bacterium]NIU37273.1 hypothetical protein [Gemmatimonadota bacterium]